jgi:hypothetical protein
MFNQAFNYAIIAEPLLPQPHLWVSPVSGRKPLELARDGFYHPNVVGAPKQNPFVDGFYHDCL